jgi:molybdopterin molybdotransferase
MLDLEEAVARVLAVVPAAVSEDAALDDAAGRVLAEEVRSPIDLPAFDNSAVDGYAVRAVDVASARPDSPVQLQLIGHVAAGGVFTGRVTQGTSAQVFTGSVLPCGADAVVMKEDTDAEAVGASKVTISARVEPGENVRAQGEDVRRGARLVEGGEFLTAARIGLLAAAGLTSARVGRRPVAGLLATGSELKEPGQSLAPSQIYESNRAALASLVRGAGALPKILPLVADSFELTCEALADAFNHCDVLVTTGGVSVGDTDLVRRAFQQVGGTLQFWKVAIKPGQPLAFGCRRGKLLFGLPGNPVSALVTFLLFVRPALLRWQGATCVSPPICRGVLAEPLANTGTRRHFLRVTVDPAGMVRSAGLQASHVMSSAAAANGLVEVPANSTLAAESTVSVLRWD